MNKGTVIEMAMFYIRRRTIRPSEKHIKPRTRYYVFSESDGVRRSHGGFNTLRHASAVRRTLLSEFAKQNPGATQVTVSSQARPAVTKKDW